MIRLKESRGFTLVEIMIVVAIIALLAAIAVPNMLRARLNANETAAIATVRALYTAAESYRAAQTPMDYPQTIDDLVDANPAYLTGNWPATAEAGSMRGYTYGVTRLGASAGVRTIVISAFPTTVNVTGVRRFAVDTSGELRADTGTQAEVITQLAYDAMTSLE